MLMLPCLPGIIYEFQGTQFKLDEKFGVSPALKEGRISVGMADSK